MQATQHSSLANTSQAGRCDSYAIKIVSQAVRLPTVTAHVKREKK